MLPRPDRVFSPLERKLLESERKRLNDGNTPYPFSDAMGKEFWTTYAAAAK